MKIKLILLALALFLISPVLGLQYTMPISTDYNCTGDINAANCTFANDHNWTTFAASNESYGYPGDITYTAYIYLNSTGLPFVPSIINITSLTSDYGSGADTAGKNKVWCYDGSGYNLLVNSTQTGAYNEVMMPANCTYSNNRTTIKAYVFSHYKDHGVGTPDYSYVQFGDMNLTLYTPVINFNVYDESSNSLFTTPTTISFIGDSYSLNTTTSTGTGNLTGFPLGYYKIEYNATGYTPSAYFLNVSTYGEYNVSLYLRDINDTSLILFNVLDEKGNPVYDGILKAQGYFIDDNAYKVIRMESIDSTGQSGMYLVPNDEYYKFIVEKDGVTLYTSNPQKVFASTLYIRVNVLDDVLYSLGVVRDSVTTNLSFNNNTKIVSYYFNDATSLVDQGCLLIISRDAIRETTIVESCQSAASATITYNISPVLANGTTYIAKGSVHTNTASSTYFTDIIQFAGSYSYDQFGLNGLFMGIMFVISAAFLGITAGFAPAVIYAGLSMTLMQVTGIVFFGWQFIIGSMIIGITMAVISK